MSGEALRMQLELKRHARKHQIVPAPCAQTAPLPPVEGDLFVEGYAAPATIDSELTRFAPECWMPFKQNVPLLYRHRRPAGEVLEVRRTDDGLYVRALVHDDEAKRCTHFSVAATVHGYQLRDVDNSERFHALVTCATLDEITLTNAPANPAAMVRHRYRQSAAVEFYDIVKRGIICAQGVVAALRVINAVQQDDAPRLAVSARASPALKTPLHEASRHEPARITTPARRKTEFRNLVEAMAHQEKLCDD